jgi:hypothetical protein
MPNNPPSTQFHHELLTMAAPWTIPVHFEVVNMKLKRNFEKFCKIY